MSLPPEVTSALIQSGPGAESLLAASEAWQELSASLEESAENYATALSSLAGNWRGPSSSAMVQAVEPYITWVRNTAQQTQVLSVSAQTAATAFNSVRAAVVSFADVVANRARLLQLLITNEFGNKLPAIAETEQEYQEMWANNSAAMIRYRTASAQATPPSQFSSPPSITNAAVSDSQAAAAQVASPAAASPAASGSPLDLLQQLYSDLSFFDNSNDTLGPNANLYNTIFSSGFPINLLSYLAQNQSAQALSNVQSQIGQGLTEGESALGPLGAGLGAPGAGLGAPGAGLSSPGVGAFGGLSEEPTAAMGAGWSVGKLTAPPAVGSLLPASQAEVRLASLASPLPAGQSAMPMLPPLMPPPISPGSGWRKRKAQKYEDVEFGLDIKGKVMPRPPSAG